MHSVLAPPKVAPVCRLGWALEQLRSPLLVLSCLMYGSPAHVHAFLYMSSCFPGWIVFTVLRAWCLAVRKM